MNQRATANEFDAAVIYFVIEPVIAMLAFHPCHLPSFLPSSPLAKNNQEGLYN